MRSKLWVSYGSTWKKKKDSPWTGNQMTILAGMNKMQDLSYDFVVYNHTSTMSFQVKITVGNYANK